MFICLVCVSFVFRRLIAFLSSTTLLDCSLHAAPKIEVQQYRLVQISIDQYRLVIQASIDQYIPVQSRLVQTSQYKPLAVEHLTHGQSEQNHARNAVCGCNTLYYAQTPAVSEAPSTTVVVYCIELYQYCSILYLVCSLQQLKVGMRGVKNAA